MASRYKKRDLKKLFMNLDAIIMVSVINLTENCDDPTILRTVCTIKAMKAVVLILLKFY
jgi:hypothetical protein